ncbi:tyrosine-type recombinase/integrase [Lactococcus petauri]|uniref:tyrosine-type recombinase/integrase n=1 Tax=Lactococcus petauri TaxID=1940789 RepID=UPI0028914645|nr:tyrosine-type recombinase/integrase [Lactococcus petauri]MDT2557538.1 tyrosine-type recombinase/integrase [Lactococcus petauri]MDT2584727.1 tyrosine-type recombinase/integrase [Lactococcus petauri]
MARYIKRGKVWQYEISYKDIDGKYKKLRKSGFPKKSDAIAEAGEIESKLAKGFNAASKDYLLSEHFEKWIEVFKKGKVSDGTYKKYLYTLSVIRSYFADMTIKTLNRTKYQQALNSYAESKSDESTRQINTHIRSSISNLVDEGIINYDFTKGAIVKGGKSAKDEDDKYLDFDDFEKLIKAVRTKLNPIYASPFMIFVGAMTGMRFSELSGLTWDHINFEEKYIEVTRTWDHSKQDFGPTKNPQSKRKISIDSKTMDTIKDFKKKQQELFNKLDIHPVHDFVFYNAQNGIINNKSINKQLNALCKKLNINTTITSHGLRHSHASMLIYKDINILYISKRLGHRSLNVTMSTYSHAIKELQDKEDTSVRNILEGIIG